MVSTKSVALFALVAMAGASSVFADKAGEASESGKMMKSPKLKLDKHAAKADEAGEALKAKPAKVKRLEESSTREREEFFSSRYLSSLDVIFPHLFFFPFSLPSSSSFPPHKQVHVKAAGEALKIVKVPKAPKVSCSFDKRRVCFSCSLFALSLAPLTSFLSLSLSPPHFLNTGPRGRRGPQGRQGPQGQPQARRGLSRRG